MATTTSTIAMDAQSANCHEHHHHAQFFPAPQLTTMTIARSSSLTMPPPTMQRITSTGANPMMRVTLPKELGDDPLASPVGALPLPAFFNEPEVVQTKQQPAPEPEPTTSTSVSSGFANVFTRRRQSSIEKKPPMVPMLRRTTSAPIKHHHPSLLSKMAPMLKRVVSGTKSVPEDDSEDDDDHYGDADSRESLLMLMQVPEIHRVSLVPLMMASHYDY